MNLAAPVKEENQKKKKSNCIEMNNCHLIHKLLQTVTTTVSNDQSKTGAESRVSSLCWELLRNARYERSACERMCSVAFWCS